MLRTAEGYTKFSRYARQCGKQWCSYVGAVNVIPNNINTDHSTEPLIGQMPAPTSGKTREPTALTPGKTREPTHVIPYEDSDIAPLSNKPTNEDFSLTHNRDKVSKLEDPSIVLTRRKHARLATIHE